MESDGGKEERDIRGRDAEAVKRREQQKQLKTNRV
jgi:hypothetical protein